MQGTMRSFSERTGLKPIRTIPADSLEPGLRNRLWNAVRSCYLSSAAWSPELDEFVRRLWDEYFKWPLDAIPYGSVLQAIRDYFFGAQWYEVYDFIEFCAMAFPSESASVRFIAQANSVFEQELAAYRFVGGRLARITSEQEIGAVEEALDASRSIDGVHERLERALELLADRRMLDYAGSIQESLHALETLQHLFNGDGRSVFERAARSLARSPALAPALGTLCAGPRVVPPPHAGKATPTGEDETFGFEDAKFTLVACSALVNYVVARCAGAENGRR
jgi:hypothetical protein